MRRYQGSTSTKHAPLFILTEQAARTWKMRCPGKCADLEEALTWKMR
jgi:hypothetical protein